MINAHFNFNNIPSFTYNGCRFQHAPSKITFSAMDPWFAVRACKLLNTRSRKCLRKHYRPFIVRASFAKLLNLLRNLIAPYHYVLDSLVCNDRCHHIIQQLPALLEDHCTQLERFPSLIPPSNFLVSSDPVSQDSFQTHFLPSLCSFQQSVLAHDPILACI